MTTTLIIEVVLILIGLLATWFRIDISDKTKELIETLLEKILGGTRVNYHSQEGIDEVETTGYIKPINNKIFWHVENTTSDLPSEATIAVFQTMFDKVQPYMKFKFTKTNDISKSQITIRFMKNGDKKLPFPFRAGVLAYAFLANNTDSLGRTSDMYFNDVFSWGRMHDKKKISLLKVAVHEMLHSLGLHHSDNRDDILYPSYVPNDKIFFSPDTIQSIYKLYGKPTTKKPTTTVTKVCYGLRKVFPTRHDVWRMKSTVLVRILNDHNVEATTDDRKRVNVNKFWTLINS